MPSSKKDQNGGIIVWGPVLSGCYSKGATGEEAFVTIKNTIQGCLVVLNERTEQNQSPRVMENTTSMNKPPVISGLMQLAFSRHGSTKSRQTGYHAIMVKHGRDVTLSVPLHDPIKRVPSRNS